MSYDECIYGNWVRVDRICTQIRKAKVCILWQKCIKSKRNCWKKCWKSNSVCDIVRMVGISLSRVHNILKNILNVRKISSRWVPHLLRDGQKKQRVKIAKQLLKVFPKYGEKKFANTVTANETWVHYFESVRKVSNTRMVFVKHYAHNVTLKWEMIWIKKKYGPPILS